MVTVSVVLPTYNRGFIVDRFLDSLLSQSYQDWELIIVDDASHDDTLNTLSKYANANKKIRVHQLETHKGLPAARNVGVSLSDGELIFFGEDDITYCNKDALKILVETFFNVTENFRAGAVGPRINGGKGYWWINDVVRIGPITRHIYHNFDYDPQKVIEVPTLHSCSLISKQAFRKIGGFDQRLYVGTYAKEEVDFYFRLRKGGYKIFFQPMSMIFHNHAYLGGCESRKKMRRYYFELRNSLLFAARFNGIAGPYRYFTLPLLRRVFPKRTL